MKSVQVVKFVQKKEKRGWHVKHNVAFQQSKEETSCQKISGDGA
jgi:hypothetical protein